jgi:hypothetical protein
MRITHCRACNKELINRRSHIKTCSSSCRGKFWRASKVVMIPIRLMFNATHYELIKSNAETIGVSINDYLIGCATMESK